MTTNSTENPVLACDPNALTHDQQEYWVKEIAPKLYKAVQEIQELSNGWAWRLPATLEMLALVAEDLSFERLCCPFVKYTLILEPNLQPFWLHMTGGEGVKEFLRIAYEGANLFDPQVAKAAGFDTSASPEIDSVEAALEATDKLNTQYAGIAASN